ncbi:hypothetical protein KUM39_13945 [Streptomyces sp. J2-1]|nr:hypothetical protein [Streptomyces corallincola]
MEQIIAAVRGFPGALVLLPEPGGEYPEESWGDAFFYYSPDGRLPRTTQPYATITTAGPDPAPWTLNIHVGRSALTALTSTDPLPDPTPPDRFHPHPFYAPQGWVSVLAPAERTGAAALRLLRNAHEAARERHERRRASRTPPTGGGSGSET